MKKVNFYQRLNTDLHIIGGWLAKARRLIILPVLRVFVGGALG
jgi:hypothetical protein